MDLSGELDEFGEKVMFKEENCLLAEKEEEEEVQGENTRDRPVPDGSVD